MWSDPEFDEAIAAAGATFARLPLSWYVTMLACGATFSLARYGDGELACMSGAEGVNTDGCRYSPDLAADLRRSLTRTDADFLYGLQRVLPTDVPRLCSLRSGPWVDSEVFGRALLSGGLFPLIDQLRRMETVLVGNAGLRPAAALIGCGRFIETPEKDTYEVKDQIIRELLAHPTPAVFLFSCGMTAKVMIAELHGRLGSSWLLDLGHLWDVFVGRRSRAELESMREIDISQNLIPAEKLEPFAGLSWHASIDGYIVWRRGTGDNAELLHLRAGAAGGGRRLLAEMLRCLRQSPPYATVFGFTRTVKVGAQAFYQAAGFTLSPVVGVYADGAAIVFSASYEDLCRRHL